MTPHMEHMEHESAAGMASLVGGIVEDAKNLFLEQLKLFKVEITNDVQRAFMAIVPIIAGAVFVTASLLLLGMGAAHLLAWAFPQLPLWAGFAITSGITAAAGAALIYWGTCLLRSVRTPDTALNELKENLQWKTKK